jgi:endoglucanase
MKTILKHCKTYLMLLLALPLFSCIACSDNDKEEDITPEITIPENILNAGITFQSTGSTQKFSVQSTMPVEATSSDPTWCAVSVGTASAALMVTPIEVTVQPNTETKDRSATITITGGGLSKEVKVLQTAAPGGIEGGDAWAVAKALGLGWNLGNQLDAYANEVANETSWGNQKTTQALFDKLAAAGITSVRIPVTWMGHIGAEPAYEIEKAWMDRVAEVVGYAENAGLKAIINLHHDGADSAHWLDIKNAATDANVNTKVKAQLKAMWTQIAERFKDKGTFLIFESMNEIHDGGWGWGANRTDGGKQYAVLNEWNQVFVDAVRAVGGANDNRYLGIPSYCTNPDYAVDGSLKLPADKASNRLMVSVHYYAPTDYTLEAKFSEWGHTAAAGKKDSWGDEDYVKDIFGKLKTTFVDKGIPVYIGEMGCVHRADARAESFRKYYLEYICKAAKTYGMAPFYWDNGGDGAGRETSGLFNHATGAYLNNGADIVALMAKAIFTEDASYTLQTVYDGAPK